MLVAVVRGSLFVVNCVSSCVVRCVSYVALCLSLVGWSCVLWMLFVSVVVVCRVLSVVDVCCVLSYGVAVVVVLC